MRKGKDIRNLGYLSILIASTLFLFPLYFNFSRANNSGNNLTEKFITDSYSKIPSGSILMVSGDLGNMTSDYYSKVQNKGSNIIAFTPGRFYLDWYLPRLLKDNPTLEVPIPSEGKLFTSATQIASANYKKGVFVSFELTEKDQDLSKNFTLYPSNLLFKVKKRGESVNIDDWKKENEALYRSIDMNVISKIKKNSPSFEENIVFAYAKYFVNCGYVYSEVKLYDEAIIEYQRALSLDNSIRDVYLLMSEALANKKDPDYLGAIQSLENYLAFLVTGEEDKFDVIVGKINDYKKRMSDIYQKEMEDMKEASPSAKPEN
jgi:tetratricopeptide (TPR) repeat protein